VRDKFEIFAILGLLALLSSALSLGGQVWMLICRFLDGIAAIRVYSCHILVK
jgi:hypothetical protein